jgi:hypothetical protein
MSELPPYRRTYDDSRISEAYRLYVDGKATQRDLEGLTGMARRTIARYSSRDGWLDERDHRTRIVAHDAAMASLTSPSAPTAADEPDLESRIATALRSPEVMQRHGGVSTQQRGFWDALMADLRAAYAEFKKKNEGKPIAASQLFPYVALGEKISVCQRKAHGMPDITKMEIDDKSALAKRHADNIQKRKAARLSGVPVQPANESEERAN